MMTGIVPSIGVQELGRRLRTSEHFTLLDVREVEEHGIASVDDPRAQLVPLSRIAREGRRALPASIAQPDAEVLVICHHGNRSLQVARWLIGQGWTKVVNVEGGIDDFARLVDPKINRY